MKLIKHIIAIILLVLCLCAVAKVSDAADYSLTFGAPLLYGFEFEGRATDQLTYCVDYSYFPAAGVDMNAYSIGGKVYFAGQSMDGIYAGLQFGVLNGSGKFLGLFDIGNQHDTFGQFRVGYKKALDSGFTYDLGIYGIAFDGDSSGMGATIMLGYTW